MSAALRPADEAALADCVREAAAAQTPLAIEGTATKAGFGRPVQAAATLSTQALTGVTLYEPTELVFSARAGTPIADVEAALAAKGQRLPFQPPDLSALYGGAAGGGTFGGVIAANLSGSNRLARGAARDCVLGVRAVNGRGEAIRSGGRVMKNVTGYDLSKALCGSFGTLAVLSEITVKVLPSPETEATLRFRDAPACGGTALMSEAVASPYDVSAVAWTPEDGVIVRLEGFADQMAYRAPALRDALRGSGDAEILEGAASTALWDGLKRLAPLGDVAGDVVWRLSVAPTAGSAALAAGVGLSAGARGWMDWAGGLVWLAIPQADAGDDGGAAALRAAVADIGGGHATLMRAPAPMRAATAVFEPEPAPIAALSRRLKDAFDPQRLFNPGRMAAEV